MKRKKILKGTEKVFFDGPTPKNIKGSCFEIIIDSKYVAAAKKQIEQVFFNAMIDHIEKKIVPKLINGKPTKKQKPIGLLSSFTLPKRE
jgi:hypothetical protein